MSESLALFQKALLLTVILSAPPLIIAVIVGVLTSLLQALLQLQDQALPFALKLVAVGVTLLLTARWISLELVGLTQLVLAQIVNNGAS